MRTIWIRWLNSTNVSFFIFFFYLLLYCYDYDEIVCQSRFKMKIENFKEQDNTEILAKSIATEKGGNYTTTQTQDTFMDSWLLLWLLWLTRETTCSYIYPRISYIYKVCCLLSPSWPLGKIIKYIRSFLFI